MIKQSAEFFSKVVQRWLPDAFVIAVILTLVVFIAGLVFQSQSLASMAEYWGGGFWKLLNFSMQMVLILVLGSVLAMSRPVKMALIGIARLAKTPSQGVILVTVVSMLGLWVNWGFGLVVAGLFAREVARQVKKSHFPLLIASAYSGMLIWHAGLSGSIPLKIASAGSDALSQLLDGQVIPLADTIFAWQNLTIVIALALSLPILLVMMMPDEEQRLEYAAKLAPTPSEYAANSSSRQKLSPAEQLEHLPLINFILVCIGAIYLFGYFTAGHSISLNVINLCLLLMGLALHLTPHSYLCATKDAIGTSSGIILQFPLYAGIMGMMVESGLASSMSQWFVEISSAETLSVVTFFSAGIVNFFVPSGGGQWAVQAPIVVPAAAELGVGLDKVAMAVAWGDAWTNMIQPFWALPLLAISGLKLRQIMGYCIVILIWSGVLISSLIYLLY